MSKQNTVLDLPYSKTIQLLNRDEDWIMFVALAAKLRSENIATIKSAVENFKKTGTRASKEDAVSTLMKYLYRRSYSVNQLEHLINLYDQQYKNQKLKIVSTPKVQTEIKNIVSEMRNDPPPSAKIAILVGNARYERHLPLVAPVSDCTLMGRVLKDMGFHVIILEDISTEHLKLAIRRISSIIPKGSFVFFYFGGHGFELGGNKYMLGIECSNNDFTFDNVVSQNFIIQQIVQSNPELTIVLLDMCRRQPGREYNPTLFRQIPPLEEYTDKCNLIIGYSTSAFQAAEELKYHESESGSLLSMGSYAVSNQYADSREESDGIGLYVTNTVKEKRSRGGSEYVVQLREHLSKETDIITILNEVQRGFVIKEDPQRPEKTDNLSKKFYLSLKPAGDGKFPGIREEKKELNKIMSIRYFTIE